MSLDSTVQLGHGSGGAMMKRLIDQVFLEAFEAPELHAGNDSGVAALPPTGRIALLVDMVVNDDPRIENAYRRGVRDDGNPTARALSARVFEPADAEWSGLGTLPASGLRIRDEYAAFDAAHRFPVDIEPTREPRGCRCGDVLRGVIAPAACPLFGRACTPEHPVGPCMVSSEGSCAAHYRYQG